MSNSQRTITDCTVAADMQTTMRLIGDFWVLNIVDAIRESELRFGEIEKAMPISPATLTNRLKKLEQEKVIIRNVATVDRQSVTYALTEKGKGLLVVLSSISDFTERYNKID